MNVVEQSEYIADFQQIEKTSRMKAKTKQSEFFKRFTGFYPNIENLDTDDLFASITPLQPDEEFAPCRNVLKWNDTTLIGVGDLSFVYGAQKSFKTSLFSLLAAACLHDTPAAISSQLSTDLERKIKVVYIDTEQNRQKHALYTMRNIYQLAGWDIHEKHDNFTYYPLRTLSAMERAAYIEQVIVKEKPDAVFLDGISDIMLDTNNNQESSEIVGYLGALAELYQCGIITILHTNYQSSKPRGHIGGELLRKAVTGVYTQKHINSDDTEYSECSFELYRDARPRPAKFQVLRDENGVPRIIEGNINETKYQEALQNFGNQEFTNKDYINEVNELTGIKLANSTAALYLQKYCDKAGRGVWRRKDTYNE